MMTSVLRVIRDEEGATMVEYALMIALVAVALVATVGLFKDGIANAFGKANTELNK